jgi:hypothetical protein
MDSDEDIRCSGSYDWLPETDDAPRLHVKSPSQALKHARELGYVPLREETGVAPDLGRLWPVEHRMWVEDIGPALGEEAEDDEERDRWLVRSPWPALSVRQVLTVLWRWVERDPLPHEREDWIERVCEVWAWDESEAVRILASE